MGCPESTTLLGLAPHPNDRVRARHPPPWFRRVAILGKPATMALAVAEVLK